MLIKLIKNNPSPFHANSNSKIFLMQKAGLLTFAIIFSSISFSFAQVSDENTKGPKKEQELWTNIKPAIEMGLGLYRGHPEFTLMYKREMKDFLWLRAGAFFKPEQYLDYNGNSMLINTGDSIMVQDFENRKGFFAGPRLGVEYRNTKKRMVKYIALDAMYRYGTSNRLTYERTYKVNSIGPYPSRIIDKTQIGEDQLVYEQTLLTHGFGTALVAGLYYPFGKKFAVAAQLQFDAFIGKQLEKSTDHISGTFKDWETYNFGEMNTSLLSEISLIYRFR
jgi:hypothetical protein